MKAFHSETAALPTDILITNKMDDATKLQAMRHIDKLDRLGPIEVHKLLTVGRYDTSGTFIEGLGLPKTQADLLLYFVNETRGTSNEETFRRLDRYFWIMSMSPEEFQAFYKEYGPFEEQPDPYKY